MGGTQNDMTAVIAGAKALIFDCDGTLVDTAPAYACAWAAGLHLSGIEMLAEWYLARVGMSEYRLMDAFEEEHGIKLPRDQVVQRMRTVFRERLSNLQEIRVIADIARQCHGRVPMAVASGGSQEVVSQTLEVTGLRTLFDTVVTVDDVAHGKPALDLFMEAARRLGIPPADCLVFEDTAEGLLAAERAGIPARDVREFIRTTRPVAER